LFLTPRPILYQGYLKNNNRLIVIGLTRKVTTHCDALQPEDVALIVLGFYYEAHNATAPLCT